MVSYTAIFSLEQLSVKAVIFHENIYANFLFSFGQIKGLKKDPKQND